MSVLSRAWMLASGDLIGSEGRPTTLFPVQLGSPNSKKSIYATAKIDTGASCTVLKNKKLADELGLVLGDAVILNGNLEHLKIKALRMRFPGNLSAPWDIYDSVVAKNPRNDLDCDMLLGMGSCIGQRWDLTIKDFRYSLTRERDLLTDVKIGEKVLVKSLRGTRPTVRINVKGKIIDALLDTGSNVSLISKNLAESLGLKISGPGTLTSVGGQKDVRNLYEGSYLDCADINSRFFVDSLMDDPIENSMQLGMDFISKCNFVVSRGRFMLEPIMC